MPELGWLARQPLFGKRILVTRAREQASGAAALLREQGADPVVVPTIEIHPPSDPSAMIDAVASMRERYDWVVFTSANGVDRLWAETRRQGKDARWFGRAKLAAVGPGTAAALGRFGLTADLVAKEHRGEGLAADLLAAIGDLAAGPRPRVLLARAEVARDVLPDTLRAAGCEVDVVAVYKTRSPPRPLLEALSSLLDSGELDVVTFTSSSTVDHLCDALEAAAVPLLAKTCVASIGPITTETAKKRGLRVDVEAEQFTLPGLVAALEKHFTK
jgi:uroporphyrinogen III methyltransferase/synthase